MGDSRDRERLSHCPPTAGSPPPPLPTVRTPFPHLPAARSCPPPPPPPATRFPSPVRSFPPPLLHLHLSSLSPPQLTVYSPLPLLLLFFHLLLLLLLFSYILAYYTLTVSLI